MSTPQFSVAPQAAPFTLPPSPLTIGQALGSTFGLLRARFGLFVALAFLPGILMGIVLLVATVMTTAAFAGVFVGARDYGLGRYGGAIAFVVVILAVAMLACFTVQVKSWGMMAILANETALGRRPDFAWLLQATKGLVRRTLMLMVVATAAVAVFTGVLLAIVLGAVASAINGALYSPRSDPFAVLGVLFAGLSLLWVVLYVASIFFTVRWLYLYQGLAIERLDGFAALGNSWRLTARDFWRTLGWYLLLQIILSIGMQVVILPMSAMLTPAMSALQRGGNPFAGAAGATLGLVYLLFIGLLVGLVGPVMAIYTTIMYIDQKRRSEMIAAGIPLYPQVAWQGMPGSQYGQPIGGQPGYQAHGQPGYQPQGQPGYQAQGHAGYPQPPANPNVGAPPPGWGRPTTSAPDGSIQGPDYGRSPGQSPGGTGP